MEAASDDPTPLRIFSAFARIGLTSFGGGLSGWMLRELVAKRRWLDEEEFLNGMAVSQALPGVNITNMSVWTGYRLGGVTGVVAALCGMVALPALVILLLAVGFDQIVHLPLAIYGIVGAGAAAIGLSLNMAIRAAFRVPRAPLPLIVMVATFVSVVFFHVPTIWAVIGFSAISMVLTYRSLPETDA